jgi:UDP-N-acetyl-D-mannosaminuronic acid dehydrogenase
MHCEFKSISVIGLGYIGLPTAATLACRGLQVIGVDVNESAVEIINAGRAHVSEPDLDALVKSAVQSGKLHAFTQPQSADAFIVAVPTPVQPDKSPDMSLVETATRSVTKVLKPGNLLILESTSPVGTSAWLANIVRAERPDLIDAEDMLSIDIAYCPERILPGKMVSELIKNDRIVGGITPMAAKRARALYSIFVDGSIHETDAATAELVKLIENGYRDVNIAFANEVANICDRLDIDPWLAIQLANKHPRVDILAPGPGVGGHCIAVDPWFIINQNPAIAKLMRAAREVNDQRPQVMIEKAKAIAKQLGTRKICCLGLSYKPDVDDLRESPAVEIAQRLAADSYEISVVEPNVKALPASLTRFSNVALIGLDEALRSSTIVMVNVAHAEFKQITQDQLRDKAVLDCVGIIRDARSSVFLATDLAETALAFSTARDNPQRIEMGQP